MGRWGVAAAALLFSTGGAAIKAASLTGWQTACLRSGVAALLLLVLARAKGGRFSWRLVPVAVCYALTLALFVIATKMTTSASAIFLQSTTPLYLLLIAPLMLQEKPARLDYWQGLVMAGGMALFFLGQPPVQVTAPDPATGNVLAAATGLTLALTIAGLRRLAKSGEGNAAVMTTALGNVLACLLALPGALPFGDLSMADASVIVYLGLVQIGLAYWLLARSLASVPAFEASVLMLLEPVFNPVWTWIVHREEAGVYALLGGGVILSATLLRAWVERGR